MLFQLKLQSKTGTSKPLPIKKRRPDLKITLKKCANEPQRARFQALFANWDALGYLHKKLVAISQHCGMFEEQNRKYRKDSISIFKILNFIHGILNCHILRPFKNFVEGIQKLFKQTTCQHVFWMTHIDIL